MQVSLSNPQLLTFQRFDLFSVDKISNKMNEDQGNKSRVLAGIVLSAYGECECGNTRINDTCNTFASMPLQHLRAYFNHPANKYKLKVNNINPRKRCGT